MIRHSRRFGTVLCASIFASTAVYAAPVTIKGASFDAPATCTNAVAALVCKLDGQQFELWVTRKPLAPEFAPADSMTQKMIYFSEVHETAIRNIMRSTGNDQATQFSEYGPYSALGAAMPGKGVPSSPAVRFASVLHDDEIWEFLEVVAARSPAVEALSNALQRSLTLPVAPKVAVAAVPESTKPLGATAKPSSAPSAPSASATPTPDIRAVSPTVAAASANRTLSGPLLSLQYPDFLEPSVVENTVSRFLVNFKHKSRAGGPNLMVDLHVPADKMDNAAALVAARKNTVAAMMLGQSGSVDVNALGEIKGVGFAFLGVPDAKKGLSGIESIETTFAADTAQGRLEIRLGAEQKYSTDTRDVWALLAKSIKLEKSLN